MNHLIFLVGHLFVYNTYLNSHRNPGEVKGFTASRLTKISIEMIQEEKLQTLECSLQQNSLTAKTTKNVLE